MIKEPYYEKKNHTYYCSFMDDKGNVFVGSAKCHPIDQDLESEKVGYTIASKRALIRYLKHYKKNEIRPTLVAFRHLYDSMHQSKKFNINSYEAKRIYKTIKTYEEYLSIYSEMIKQEEEDLKQYIEDKNNLKEKVRKIRLKGENK